MKSATKSVSCNYYSPLLTKEWLKIKWRKYLKYLHFPDYLIINHFCLEMLVFSCLRKRVSLGNNG
jgi:hypothetical protein